MGWEKQNKMKESFIAYMYTYAHEYTYACMDIIATGGGGRNKIK